MLVQRVLKQLEEQETIMSVRAHHQTAPRKSEYDDRRGIKRANQRGKKGQERREMSMEDVREQVRNGIIRCALSKNIRPLISQRPLSMDERYLGYPANAALLDFARRELKKPLGQRKAWTRLCAIQGLTVEKAARLIERLWAMGETVPTMVA